jgi:hypothetical protein
MDEFPEPHMEPPRPDYACVVYCAAGVTFDDLGPVNIRLAPAVLCAWALTKLTGRDVRFWCRDRDKGFAVFRLEPRR